MTRHQIWQAAAFMLLVTQGDASVVTTHVKCVQSGPECGAALQSALDSASAGAIITLEPGKTYEGSFVLRARPGASPASRVTITTRGWKDKGPGWDGLVTPADKPRLAVLRAARGNAVTLTIEDGAGSGHVQLVGLAIETAPPGSSDMIRIGSGKTASRDELPSDVTLRQVLLQGDREAGQKRGVAANGVDIEIAQVWCDEIFVAGQDSQCIAGWSGSTRVRVHHSYLAAGSENILIGGATIGTASMQPAEWVIEDVILHKPLRWQEDGRNRQVKNLLEFKHGRNITVRRVLAVNNWKSAQDGRGLLINYTTNGRCPECGNLENVLIEDFVMLNSEAGISLQGYSWQPESHSDGKLLGVTLRNLYVHLSGPGRLIQITNVRDRHNIRIERSTFINQGSTWVVGSYGRAWQDDKTIVDGGPMKGLTLLDNVVAANGQYGITAPDSHHYGRGIQTFVGENLQIAGNVIGDAPSAHLANYNDARADGEKNVSVTRDRLLAKLPVRTCGEWSAGKGADCARLEAVFDLLRRLPEP